MKKHLLALPLKTPDLKKIKAGDQLFLSGTIYTARDAAHQKLQNLIWAKKKLPFELKNSTIYYVGPTPARPPKVIGSCGPTTSYRMDPFLETMLKKGLKLVIGKGERSESAQKLFSKYQAIYALATGGAGALLAKFVIKSDLIAFPELGTEAIRKLEIKNFPVFVAYDIHGQNIYEKKLKARNK